MTYLKKIFKQKISKIVFKKIFKKNIPRIFPQKQSLGGNSGSF